MSIFENKTKWLIIVLAATAVASVSAFYVVGKNPAALLVQTTTPTVGTLTATPSSITNFTVDTPTVVPTVVTVTVKITDPGVVAGGVNLLRLNPTGNPTVLGIMNDDGLRGDAVANDKIFTLEILSETETSSVRLQVSAAFKGFYKPVLSNIVAIIVNNQSIQLYEFVFVEVQGRPGHGGYAPIQGAPVPSREATIHVTLLGDVQSASLDLIGQNGNILANTLLSRPQYSAVNTPTFYVTLITPNQPFHPRVNGLDSAGRPFVVEQVPETFITPRTAQIKIVLALAVLGLVILGGLVLIRVRFQKRRQDRL